MKKIVCELCESTEFVKEGGFFVCQGCGTKYSLEETKGMMRDDGAVQAPSKNVVREDGTVMVPPKNSGQGNESVVVPFKNSGNTERATSNQQLDNILVLATNACEAQNFAEAENYCNQAIMLDSSCYKAWLLKGKAIGWQSSAANLRLQEASHSFVKAIDFAPAGERAKISKQAVEELKKLGLAVISLRNGRFSKWPDTEELNGFSSDLQEILESLSYIVSNGNDVDQLNDYMCQIAVIMTNAAVSGTETARELVSMENNPADSAFVKYLDYLGNCENLVRRAICLNDDDDEANIRRYENLKVIIEDPIGRWVYKYEWISVFSEFRWIPDREYLSNTAASVRKQMAAECDTRIAEIRRKIGEKEKAKIKQYWEEHDEEKTALEADYTYQCQQKSELEEELSSLEAKVKEIDNSKKKAPSEIEKDRLFEERMELSTKRSNLGFFARKEKEAITSKIAEIDAKCDELKIKAEEEERQERKRIQDEKQPFNAKIDEIKKQLGPINKRISEIQSRLSSIPVD